MNSRERWSQWFDSSWFGVSMGLMIIVSILLGFALLIVCKPVVARAQENPRVLTQQPPAEIMSGYSKGFATKVRVYGSDSKRVDFLINATDLTPKLTLSGRVAEQYIDLAFALGGAFIEQPEFTVTDAHGTVGTIYRFNGGILIELHDKVIMLPGPYVMNWETRYGGYKGKGFPTYNPHKSKPAPAPDSEPSKSDTYSSAPNPGAFILSSPTCLSREA